MILSIEYDFINWLFWNKINAIKINTFVQTIFIIKIIFNLKIILSIDLFLYQLISFRIELFRFWTNWLIFISIDFIFEPIDIFISIDFVFEPIDLILHQLDLILHQLLTTPIW